MTDTLPTIPALTVWIGLAVLFALGFVTARRTMP